MNQNSDALRDDELAVGEAIVREAWAIEGLPVKPLITGQRLLGRAAIEAMRLTQPDTSHAPNKCQCSFRIKMVGDGCQHCQPQEYIGRLQDWLAEEREENERHARACEVLRELVGAIRFSQEAMQRFANDGKPDNYCLHMDAEDLLSSALDKADAILKGEV